MVNLLNRFRAPDCRAERDSQPGLGQDVKELLPPTWAGRAGRQNGFSYWRPDQEALTTLKYSYQCECVKWEFNLMGRDGRQCRANGRGEPSEPELVKTDG